ncbi:hypothetical protein ACFFMM_28455 [Micromonospora chaiyaphumensis]|uniref:Uncharacterized protein n=1 Tax=Micromonospora chaiyaphumensis TaxID=307119 RepID=A0A1C4Z2S3_9ACTN|nr:hypothetical protein [Micromonospora chaiyaphumensis]SCF27216.1 hypothetical protein GA0070214_11183 [Micromonospora chaiyaphumensis]
MRNLGSSIEFREQPWPAIAARLHGVLDDSATYEPVLDIVDSVIAFEAEALLAGTTSMFDLVVTPKPITPPPVDVVVVRSLYGRITIEHISHTGRNDRIERPAQEGVALFWRFMIEKFVHPTPTGAPPDQEIP